MYYFPHLQDRAEDGLGCVCVCVVGQGGGDMSQCSKSGHFVIKLDIFKILKGEILQFALCPFSSFECKYYDFN